MHVRAGDSEVGSGLAAALGDKRTRRRFAKKCLEEPDVSRAEGQVHGAWREPRAESVTARQEARGDHERGAFQRTPEMWLLLVSAVSNGDREAR